MQPADPLPSAADPAAQAPADQPHQPVEGRGVAVKHDAGAQDDLTAAAAPTAACSHVPASPSRDSAVSCPPGQDDDVVAPARQVVGDAAPQRPGPAGRHDPHPAPSRPLVAPMAEQQYGARRRPRVTLRPRHGLAMTVERRPGGPRLRGREEGRVRGPRRPFQARTAASRRLSPAITRRWRQVLTIARGPLVLVLWPLAYESLDVLGTARAAQQGTFELVLTGFAVVPLLARRRFPVPAWAVVLTAHTVLLYATPYWSAVAVGSLLVLLATIAARSSRALVAFVGTVTAVATLWSAASGPNDAQGLPVLVILLSIVALVLGDNRRTRIRSESDVAAREEEVRDEQGRRALLEERTRIARELHDVVAHHMSMIAVQSETAPYRIPDLPAEGRADFSAINATAREALVELRRLLGVLRAEGTAERAPQPGLDRLDELLDGARAAGLGVSLSVEGDPRPLPAGVDLSAYRIVQEAVTNARRHAGDARVDVRVAYDPDRLRVSVTDDGTGVADGDGAPGHGLLGMRERVVMLGGELSAGPRPEGGFAVDATLPLPADGEAVA